MSGPNITTARGDGIAFFAHVNGVRIEAARIGEGPDIVWCHGLTGNLEDGRLSAETTAARGFRVTWFSCRGHGRSTPVTTKEECAYYHFADDLSALIDHLGIDRPLLAGGSHGSNTILSHEAIHPGRARALLCVAPGGNSLEKPGGWKWAGLRLVHWNGARKGPDGVARLALGPNPDPILAAAYKTHDPASILFAMRNIPAQAAVDIAALRRFAVPVHIAAWDKDPVIHPIAVARRIAAAIPGATFEQIDRVTTLPAAEVAVLVADLLERWARRAVANPDAR